MVSSYEMIDWSCVQIKCKDKDVLCTMMLLIPLHREEPSGSSFTIWSYVPLI